MSKDAQALCLHCPHLYQDHTVDGVCRTCGETARAFARFPERADPKLSTYCPGFEAARSRA